jgi:FlaA1/EpsC-like NDP-sugar epimerase
LLGPSIKNKVCCVTGAGGSIGSELVKQIIRLIPKKIVLFEINEYSLYSLMQEISNINEDLEIVHILGDATKKNIVRNALIENSVDVLFHAAAYKHVPLVEENPLTGVFNNIVSTRLICEEALRADVEKVVFISTDKAVRPTNVMGASKRLGELIVQSYSELVTQDNKLNTIYSIVRFGNVLGSSGSVIPLFKKQILQGGPITLTHPDVTRYFMTIEEAVSLVIQTSVLSKGGEVFLLDMGKPVKIIELAKQMIKLSGLNLRDENNINGDIDIKVVGLREGEKLYEELLIDAKAEETEHSLIFKARESFIPFDKLKNKLDILEEYLVNNDTKLVLSVLKELVPEWERKKDKID